MRIYPGIEIIRQMRDKAKAQDQPVGGGRFFEVYMRSIGNSLKQKDIKAIQKPMINDTREIASSNTAPLRKNDIMGRVENLLDLLDEYRKKLADPQVSLKELSPLIDKITLRRTDLIPILDSFPEQDSLKEILHRTLIMASLEVIRFNRGDYIARTGPKAPNL